MNDFLNEIQDEARKEREQRTQVPNRSKQKTTHPKEDLARYNQALEYASKELNDLKNNIKSLRQQKLDLLVEVEDVKLRKSKSVENELNNLVLERDRLKRANEELQRELTKTKEERVSLVKQKVLLETKESVLTRERSETEKEKDKYISYKKDLLNDQKEVDTLKRKYEASIQKYNELTNELQYKIKKHARNEALVQDREVEVGREVQRLKIENAKQADQLQMIKVQNIHLAEKEKLVQDKERALKKRTEKVLELEKRANEIHQFVQRTIQIMDTQKETMSRVLTDYALGETPIRENVRRRPDA